MVGKVLLRKNVVLISDSYFLLISDRVCDCHTWKYATRWQSTWRKPVSV